MPLYSEILKQNSKPQPKKPEASQAKIMFLLTRDEKTNELKGVNRKPGYRDGVKGFNLVPPMNSNKFDSSFSAELFANKIGLRTFELMTYNELQEALKH